MVIQTRVFRRLVELGNTGNKVRSGLYDAMDEVVAEVNDFIAPLGDKCIQVEYKIDLVDHYNHACYHATVIYIE